MSRTFGNRFCTGDYIGDYYWDNGKSNGNYRDYRVYIGIILGTIIGIRENKMENYYVVYWGYRFCLAVLLSVALCVLRRHTAMDRCGLNGCAESLAHLRRKSTSMVVRLHFESAKGCN